MARVARKDKGWRECTESHAASVTVDGVEKDFFFRVGDHVRADHPAVQRNSDYWTTALEPVERDDGVMVRPSIAKGTEVGEGE
jgi:hypothetical protein